MAVTESLGLNSRIKPDAMAVGSVGSVNDTVTGGRWIHLSRSMIREPPDRIEYGSAADWSWRTGMVGSIKGVSTATVRFECSGPTARPRAQCLDRWY